MKVWIVCGSIVKPESWEKAIVEGDAMLKKYGVEVEVYRRKDILYTIDGKGKRTFYAKGQEVSVPDVLLTYGQFDAALEGIERALVGMGVKSINPMEGKRIACSKLKTALLFAEAGLPQAKMMPVYRDTPIEIIKKEIGIPLVVKPDVGFGGKGVELLKTEEELKEFLDSLPEVIDDVMLAQKYVSTSKGRDLRVITLNGKVFISIIRQVDDPDEFRSNIHQGGHYVDFDMTEEAIRLSEKVSEVSGLGLCGIDLLFGEDGFVIGEINDSPGMALLIKKAGPEKFFKLLMGAAR